MAVRVVVFSSRGYKIGKIFAKPSLAFFGQSTVCSSLVQQDVMMSDKLSNYVFKIIANVFDCPYTVVKRGHTEGIEREKTSSEKYTEISL